MAIGPLQACVEETASAYSMLSWLEAVGVQEAILGFPDVLQPEPLRFFAREFIA